MTGTTHASTPGAFATAMRRAISLSTLGPSWGINPRVGCVLLDVNGAVLAEGWHRGAGTAHAEVDALSQLPPSAARGATAVVTLEPCNHTGRTGPCSEALLRAGIGRLVYGVRDPGPASSGGAERLANAGVDVIGGVSADEVSESIHAWLTAERLRRPFVTIKWASSLDGRIAAADGSSRWITGDPARHDVHERRAAVDAIVAGTGTVLADDPSLTARRPDGSLAEHQPVPVIIGERPVPDDAAVRRGPVPALVYPDRDLPTVLTDLFERGIRSVFVEGGPTLASAFLAAGLWDEILTYTAPVLIGGPRLAVTDIGVGTLTDAPRLTVHDVRRLGDDVLFITRPKGR
ncbi:bifunctional diaminohydroxyphosphoribosylaminopyrimidine deaminase/5-amino-6-(5-phosphoribosylamino)uracil reductase RibD [Planctomonas psychrotolerans]|uniref:bifunctional diaminohydroxyphosphoribosylaminopyrimidine deaminase/5-amino-6-(5-phosphoribosylamino)uracil reductase RibD n=1 Tax=Planctomonas psychrotolerans TaxID=2528712 RepID=UPI001D0CE585|nr:bifunctional diaminohydroxyphosphoribosylaminopyrimidine deaminase/5-amino-6-(5-phosphoribosylamino)uracil reductase RibD [Planctomonas psychrotolerans]